ncbi:Uncharacterised protein [Lysinibacillus sphaericus]|nr:Uncharacterised protein [Lysinibacillus sphaericus]
MKTLKRLVFFIAIFNLTFITILILQFQYRFNHSSNFDELIMYASIFSITISIIPLVCFGITRFIFWGLKKSRLQLSPFLQLVLILLITVTLTYILIDLTFHDSIFSLICVLSTMVTLILFFYMDSMSSKRVSMKNDEEG